MKALLLKSYEGLRGLDLVDAPAVAKPRKGEVLIKVAAAPINPSDLIFIRGQNPLARPLPTIPGFEGSGTVVGVGTGATEKNYLGQRVACRAKPGRGGTWAEYVVTDAARCIKLRRELTMLQGATLLINPLTAYGLVHFAQKEGHQGAIQTAARSSAGQMIIRFARKRRLPLINIVRRESHVRELKSLGCRWVLNSESVSFVEELGTLALKLKATVAFDAVAGELSGRVLRAMPSGSDLWSYGGLSNNPCSIDAMVLVYGQKRVRGMFVPPLMFAQGTRFLNAAAAEIQKDIRTIFQTDIRSTLAPDQFQQAITAYEASMSSGKIVLQFSALD
jgi:NADPH2:quinone reductase